MAMSRSLGWTLLTTRSPIAIVARGDVFQPGDHPQQGRFAAAGGADQHDKGAVLDRNRDAVQDLKAAKRFPHIANLHRRHTLPSRIHRAVAANAAASLI
jgi:hypothetical protein